MKLFDTILPSLFACCLLASCATSNVYTDKREDTDFNQYQTYAWLPMQDSGSAQLYDNEILQANLMNQVDEELIEKGYGQSSQNPDLLILMHVMFDRDTAIERTPVYGSYTYAYPRWYVYGGYPYFYNHYNTFGFVDGYNIDTVTYTEGTVVIDVIDVKTGRLVWRGWSESMINADNYKSNLKKDVKAILKAFPQRQIETHSSSTKRLNELRFYQITGAW